MRSVTIAGLGLIGGSIGIALRRRGWHVRYLDPAVTLDQAKRAGAADDRADSLDGAALLVLATPLDVAVRELTSSKSPLVTSTCSVMGPLRRAGRDNFVAGHPFAGSEKSGLDAARGDLFEGKAWFVDRDEPAVRAIVEACGARQVLVGAEQHDETMALTSHLPQVISTALASLIEQKGIDPQFIGSGVRTLLRLAGSAHEVWGPVLEENREHVARAAEELRKVIEALGADDFKRAQKLHGDIGTSPSRPQSSSVPPGDRRK